MLSSTAPTWARFAQMMLTDGELDGVRLFSTAPRWPSSPSRIKPGRPSRSIRAGLGWGHSISVTTPANNRGGLVPHRIRHRLTSTRAIRRALPLCDRPSPAQKLPCHLLWLANSSAVTPGALRGRRSTPCAGRCATVYRRPAALGHRATQGVNRSRALHQPRWPGFRCASNQIRRSSVRRPHYGHLG